MRTKSNLLLILLSIFIGNSLYSQKHNLRDDKTSDIIKVEEAVILMEDTLKHFLSLELDEALFQKIDKCSFVFEVDSVSKDLVYVVKTDNSYELHLSKEFLKKFMRLASASYFVQRYWPEYNQLLWQYYKNYNFFDVTFDELFELEFADYERLPNDAFHWYNQKIGRAIMFLFLHEYGHVINDDWERKSRLRKEINNENNFTSNSVYRDSLFNVEKEADFFAFTHLNHLLNDSIQSSDYLTSLELFIYSNPQKQIYSKFNEISVLDRTINLLQFNLNSLHCGHSFDSNCQVLYQAKQQKLSTRDYLLKDEVRIFLKEPYKVDLESLNYKDALTVIEYRLNHDQYRDYSEIINSYSRVIERLKTKLTLNYVERADIEYCHFMIGKIHEYINEDYYSAIDNYKNAMLIGILMPDYFYHRLITRVNTLQEDILLKYKKIINLIFEYPFFPKFR